MQDLLLLAVLAAISIFGWLVMKGVDRFLDDNRRARRGKSHR